MIAVEEQALKRHALMRHVYGVHFAGNGVRTRSIHPDISPAADQRGKRIRFDMKHEIQSGLSPNFSNSFMYQSEGIEFRRFASEMLDCRISSTAASSVWVLAFVAQRMRS